MDLLLLFLLLLGAFLAGLLGSMLGVGGGIIIVPLLTIGFGVSLSVATGASIMAIIVTSSAGATFYVERKIVNIRLGMLLEVATAAAAIIGALAEHFLVAVPLGQIFLKILLGVVLIYAAYYMTFKRPESLTNPKLANSRGGIFGDIAGAFHDEASGKEVNYLSHRVSRGLMAALVAGILSGLFGIGGGIIMVPAMILWMDVPTKAATATSNFMIGVTGAAGAAIYYTTGTIVPSIVAPVTVGVFAGAMVGSRVASRVKSLWLRRIFAILLVVTAIDMVARALGSPI